MAHEMMPADPDHIRFHALADMPIRSHFTINAYLGNPPERTLWKFLQAWKFNDLLQTKALWFSSFDILRAADEAEGTVPQPNLVPPVEAFVDVVGPHLAHANGMAEEVGRAFRALVDQEAHLNLVNCWFMNELPLDHMWDRYAAEIGSVAVRSRTLRVAGALNHEGENPETYAFPCVYIDDAGVVTMKHFLAPFLVKRRAYADEWEMRYLVRVAEPVHPGIHVAVRLEEMIDEVVVNAGGSSKVLAGVRQQMAGAHLDVPVEPR
jgi:hypothetical protein